MPQDMSLLTSVATQLAFILLLFKLYRELTGVKDATIARKEAEVRIIERIVQLKDEEIARHEAEIARNARAIAHLLEQLERVEQTTIANGERRNRVRRACDKRETSTHNADDAHVPFRG